MKLTKINLIFFFLILAFGTQAQIVEFSDKGLSEIAKLPRFPGCEDMKATEQEKEKCADKKLSKYIGYSLRYPRFIQVTQIGIKRVATISCIIEEDGSVTSCYIAEDPGQGFGEEALRICKEMPKWIPAMVDGEPVLAQYIFTIDFGIDHILPDEQKQPISFLVKNNRPIPYDIFTSEGVVKIPASSTMMASSRVGFETFFLDKKGRRYDIVITPELEFKKIDLKRTLNKKRIVIAKR